MTAFKTILISFGTMFFVVCCSAMLLFNWHALGYKTLDVPTGSMRPTISPDSLVLMKSVPITAIKDGDIITYTNPRNLSETITHRVIKSYMIATKIPAFITKGDANPSTDPPVVSGYIKGKVVWDIPYLGKLMQWSKTWTGLALLVYLPALLLMFDEVKKLADYLRYIQPYKLPGYNQTMLARTQTGIGRRLTASATLSIFLVAISAGISIPTVYALLKSNTVDLTNNTITIAPKHQCSNGSNNISINSSSTQTATSGSSNSSDNTSGGTASSGNSSNSNSTSVSVNVNNC